MRCDRKLSAILKGLSLNTPNNRIPHPQAMHARQEVCVDLLFRYGLHWITGWVIMRI